MLQRRLFNFVETATYELGLAQILVSYLVGVDRLFVLIVCLLRIRHYYERIDLFRRHV